MLVKPPALQWAGRNTFYCEESNLEISTLHFLWILLFFLSRRKAELYSQESNPANTLTATQHPTQTASDDTRQLPENKLETLDSLSGASWHTHRWCRLCWCCALWLAPGRCPADRDAPGRCQPCWHPAAGVGWKSPSLSSPLSSVWCEMGLQRNVVSGVKLVLKTLLPTPPASTNELNTSHREECIFV